MNIQSLLPADLFKDRTVFVTGGGSGVNLGIARAFAAVGASLGLCGRTLERLEVARAELESLGARVSIAVADVRDPEALEAAFQKTQTELGPIHTLVCGAAGNFPCPAEQLSPNGFKAVVDIDLRGAFNASRLAFGQLKETRGNIIFISAAQAFIPYEVQAHVGAAKAGVDHLMRNLALEWGPYGIRSNSLAPGAVEGTEGFQRLLPSDPHRLQSLRETIPLHRFGTTEDLGMAAVFLASPLAAYITGTLLVVDGGFNLQGSGLYTHLLKEE